ncbi:MAG: YfhO family protein [Oscillospiraceae bacterium]|nr:YfhO family protein [Oscillospiraceae bacterium]
MKKGLKIFAAAFATGGLLLILYATKDLFPFGENTVSWCDMNQQVVPLLCELKDILSGKGSLFLNLQNAGGMNFWGVFLFFIASPFSFLVAFVEKSQMMHLANILVLLKMMLCAGCASLFFDRVFPKLRAAFTLLLSVSYAFCGYTMLFYQNVVWLDMMYLFPLLLLSLRRLEKSGSFLPFAFCLAAMITVNFYLSYMLVLFLILAVGIWVLFFSPRETRGQRTVQLGAGTVGAAVLSAVVWLPALLQYLNSARGGNLFQSLGSGSFFTPFSTIGMLVLCTAMIVPVFIFQSLRCIRGEMENPQEPYILALFSLMLIPLIIEPINKIWHTGNYQAFPGRYGYIFVLLGLCLAAQILQRPVEPACRRSAISWAVLLFLLLASAVFAACILWQMYPKTLSTYTRTLWGNDNSLQIFLIFFLLAAACYGLGLFLYRHRLLSHRLFVICLCVLTVTESLFYSTCFFSSTAGQPFLNVTSLEGQIQDDGFYRVKNNRKNYDINYTGAIGYNTLNHYTSLTGEYYLQGIRKLGYSGYWMEVSSVGGTLISDALLNQKYTIYRQEPLRADTVYSDGEYSIRQNSYFLPLGIVTSANLSQEQDLKLSARPYTGEHLLQTLSGGPSMVQEYHPAYTNNVSLTRDGEFYNITREKGGDSIIVYQLPAEEEARTYYFDCGDSLENNLSEPYYKAFSIYVDGDLVCKEYPTQSLNGILELTVSANQPARITITVHKDVSVRSFGVFSVSHEALETNLAAVRTAQLQVGRDTVTGTATAQEDGEYLFLSLPYDKGYTATVNGQTIPVLRVFDTWMALPLSQGENTVELRYQPPGFAAGAVLSAAGLVFLLAAGFFLYRKGLRLQRLEKLSIVLLSVLTAGVFAVIYLMPVVVYLVYQILG